MTAARNNKLYNYLVNQYGISRDMVLAYVRERIEDLLNKHITDKLNSNYIENLILNRVTQVVTEGVSVRGGRYGFYDRTAFDDYLQQVVKKVLEKRLNEEYTVDVKFVRKDASIVGKV